MTVLRLSARSVRVSRCTGHRRSVRTASMNWGCNVSANTNPFDDPKILNSDVIDKLTDEQVATILEMFNRP